MDHEISVRVEKIKNGFLSHCSTSGPDKKGDYQYNRETMFHRTDPSRSGQVSRILKNLRNSKGMDKDKD